MKQSSLIRLVIVVGILLIGLLTFASLGRKTTAEKPLKPPKSDSNYSAITLAFPGAYPGD